MQKNLTLQEEQAIRLVHHNFNGWTRKKAAECMHVSIQRLSTILRNVKKKAPQLFPILTENQYFIYTNIIKCGQDRQSIAYHYHWPISKVDAIIAQLRKKGISLTVPKTVQYKPYMDGKVVRKF